ncbi:MAG: glycosyltransferase family 4 protein [Patescibacteria group bacterium]
MKKTLLITLEFAPFFGGVGRYLYNMAKHLPPQSIFIMTPPHADSAKFDQKQYFSTTRTTLISNNPFLWPKWIFSYGKVKRFVKEKKIEHLLVSHVLPIGTVAWMLKRRKGITYSVVCHGTDVLSAQSKPGKRRLMLRIFNNAEKIITNSQYTLDLIKNLGDYSNKLLVITPATDILERSKDNNQEEIRNKYDLHDKKILLTVGRLVARKGHDIVIKALKQAAESIPDLVYLIIGKGPEEAKLKRLVGQLGLNDKVIFAGAVPDRQLPSFYQLCHLFISVGRQQDCAIEGFGIVFLEANAFCKPVIAGDSGGVKEAVVQGETGFLVDPQDQQAISKHIIQLLQNRQLAHDMGAKGKERVINEFSWLDRAKKLSTILS